MPARSRPLSAQKATQRSGVISFESMRAPVRRRAFESSAAQMSASRQPALVRGVEASAGATDDVGVTVVVKMTRACRWVREVLRSAGWQM